MILNMPIKNVKEYWVNSARYDWYEARKKGNIFERLFYNLRIKYILSLVGLKGKVILDMGCGTGVNTPDLCKKGGKVIGIDISPWAIGMAKKRFRGIDFYVRDSEKTKFPGNYFDVVINTGLIQYLKRPERTVREMRRILKPGGIAIVDVPWRYGIYNSAKIRSYITGKNNPNDEPINVTYDAKMLKQLFRGFRCIKITPLFFVMVCGVFRKE